MFSPLWVSFTLYTVRAAVALRKYIDDDVHNGFGNFSFDILSIFHWVRRHPYRPSISGVIYSLILDVPGGKKKNMLIMH